MSANTDLIAKAINLKIVISFMYDGHNRKVEPHHYGMLNGKVQFQGYQIDGSSNSGPLGWKNFEIDKIKNLTLGHSIFQTRDDHNPSNSKYSKIIKTVS